MRGSPSSRSRSRPDTTSRTPAPRSRRKGIRIETRQDVTPAIADAAVFDDPKGTQVQLFAHCTATGRDRRSAGRRPDEARPPRPYRAGRQGDHRFLRRESRLPGVGLDGELLLVPALRARPPHGEFSHRRQELHASHRVRAEGLGPYGPSPARRWVVTSVRSCGGRCGTASGTISRSTTATPTTTSSSSIPSWTR